LPPVARQSARREVPITFPTTVLNSLDRLDRAHAALSTKLRSWSVHSKLYLAVTTVMACLLLVAGNLAIAGQTSSSVTDLGKPTNALPPFRNPAAEFRHTKLNLRS